MPQFCNPIAIRSDGWKHARRPCHRQTLQGLLQQYFRLLQARTICLIECEGIPLLGETRFICLKTIAPSRIQDDQYAVCQINDIEFNLANAQRLNDDQGPLVGIEQVDSGSGGGGNAPLVSPGGHRPEEDPVAKVPVVNTNPVSQQRTSGYCGTRVHCEYCHRGISLQCQGQQSADQ